MAKNKNRKQAAQPDRASAAERGSDEARSTAYESGTQPQSQAQGSPADVARKHQKRFGHN
uniref:Small hydrophilic protein n=1 Tax=Streptomyces sp. NBC_01401 TaxID=2903854 RepID=A0AAU3GZG6_9ACTN